MTRVARRAARTTGGHDIKINGKPVNIYLAKIVYKCAECFGELEQIGAGLKCKSNPEHRRFVHRNEVEQIQKQHAQNVEALGDFYEIIDGKVAPKWQ